ncbi:serine protease snake-like [Thrips palmi]|uniref:Serine protease snake-like n=1 Tax=Thrips palmi TaxID=161013 RepID=A0A6P8Z4E6_THRPL|nr:serine protease snake-like [Thrips palmi]
MVRFYLLVEIFVVFFFALGSDACQTHDQPCTGGGLGNCCGGQNLVCHKACPGWRQGRCYHRGKTLPGCLSAAAVETTLRPPPSDGNRDEGSPCFNSAAASHGVCTHDCEWARHQTHAQTCGGDTRAHSKTIWCCPASHHERKATQMCREYSKHPWLDAERRSPTGQVSKRRCMTSLKPLMAGAERAQLQEYPHMALIGGYNPDSERNLHFWCGGSLISLDFVLTAAHCQTRKTRPTHVRLGGLESNGSSSEPFAQTIEVVELFIPSSYKPPKLYSDLLLLKLKQSVKVGDYVRPACLHPGGTVKKDLEVTGWGATYDLERGRGLHKNLMKLRIYKQKSSYCENNFQPDPIDRKLPEGLKKSSQLCAKPSQRTQGICQGDSGGPLSYYMDSYEDPFMCMHTVYGITSMNPAGTCESGDPVVFTRVSYHLSWIEQIVWP